MSSTMLSRSTLRFTPTLASGLFPLARCASSPVVFGVGMVATRGFASTSSDARELKKITVFGAGLMGAGIAQVAQTSGLQVTLADVTPQALDNGRSIISKSLSRIAKKKFASAPDAQSESDKYVSGIVNGIKMTTDAEEAVQDADLVIEAIIENIKTKKDLFGYLDAKAPEKTVFASNTSSLSIKDVAQATKRMDRFGGFHAFNPVPQMKLVEVIRIPETSDETFDSLMELAKKVGKMPVACTDSPGFIVNRLLVPYMLEAIRLVERGEASMEDVDTAMKLGAGYPMGPFELSDLVGLDTLSHIAKGWREDRVPTGEINEEAVQVVGLLEDKVSQGKLGRKTGEGFYSYGNKR